MDNRYYIGIDLGTSCVKVALFDKLGHTLKTVSSAYTLSQPKNGWAEQDPNAWWSAVKESLAEVCAGVETIAGIGLTGQMHGLVMLDGANEVIRPAILWCDQRSAAECEQITALIGRDRLIEITANPALPSFTASKILWVKNHEPENYAQCKHILLPKDYIRYKLTDDFATDVSDASGMQLLDVKKRAWSDEILERLGIDRAWLPTVYESPEVTGSVQIGLCKGVPVIAGAGDNAAAAVGTGVVKNGKAFVTIGTSGVVFVHTDEMITDKQGRIHTFCCAVPGKWHVMGVTQAAGLSLKWFRDTLADNLSYSDIDALVDTVLVGADGLIYLPYLMGERTPWLDENARGVFFGLSAIHTKAHLVRAVMEGVTFSLLDCLNIIRENGAQTKSLIACGGGATSGIWRAMMADCFGIPIATASSTDAPCLGAAVLAMVGTGIYPGVEQACAAIVQENNAIPPDLSMTNAYARYYAVYMTLYPHLRDSFGELQEVLRTEESM